MFGYFETMKFNIDEVVHKTVKHCLDYRAGYMIISNPMITILCGNHKHMQLRVQDTEQRQQKK
jgi:hypothetical protein